MKDINSNKKIRHIKMTNKYFESFKSIVPEIKLVSETDKKDMLNQGYLGYIFGIPIIIDDNLSERYEVVYEGEENE